METIIAALISGVAVIVAAIIAARERRRAKDAETNVEQLEKSIAETSGLCQEDYLRRYAFKAASVTDVRTIKDLQGTVEQLRQYHGVKIMDKGISLASLPGRVWVAPGRIVEDPSLVAPTNFSKAVTLAIKSRAPDRCEFTVEIAGGLTEADPGLDYGFRTTYSRGVVMTKEEVEQAYREHVFKNEYQSFDVDFPLDELELCVKFPERYRVECFPAVFVGYSERMHNLELERAKGGLKVTPTEARLRVKEPLLGFRYAIYWLAPPEKEFARLRAEA